MCIGKLTLFYPITSEPQPDPTDLLSMDHPKEGIGLRGYGQKDPLVEYKKESFKLFQDMMDRIEDETVRYLYFLRFEQSAPALPFSMDERVRRG
jgi:preprotein translocase subunit SecA